MRALSLLLLALLPVALPAVAHAAPSASSAPIPADAGLAVVVSGAVTYRSAASATPSPVTPYMKLRVGDAVEVPAGGRLEVLYFGSGRREAWPASSSVKITASGGQALTGAATAVEVGENVGHSLESLPVLLRQAQTYQAGQTLVRGHGNTAPAVPLDAVELAQAAEARALYTQLRANAPADDVFPELYLTSVLLPLGLHAESEEILLRATVACPACAEPRALLEWVRARQRP